MRFYKAPTNTLSGAGTWPQLRTHLYDLMTGHMTIEISTIPHVAGSIFSSDKSALTEEEIKDLQYTAACAQYANLIRPHYHRYRLTQRPRRRSTRESQGEPEANDVAQALLDHLTSGDLSIPELLASSNNFLLTIYTNIFCRNPYIGSSIVISVTLRK